MPQRKNKKNVNAMFNVLNSELGNKSQKRNSGKKGTASKKTTGKKKASAADSSRSRGKSSNKSGLGWVKVLVFFVVALTFAWAVFMPAESSKQLNGYFLTKFSEFTEQLHNFQKSAENIDSEAQHTIASTSAVASSDTSKASTKASTAASSSAAATTTTKKTTAASSAHNAVNSSKTMKPDNIKVYLKSQLVVIYDSDGGVVKAFKCSSGKSSTPTRTGDYAIHHQYRWRLMNGNCYAQYASAFSGSYLFHSVPYYKRDASTLFNAAYDKLGSVASAGCIRLCCRDAKWIYDNCSIGTKVKVVNTAAPSGIKGEAIPARIKKKKYNGWDPTDTSADSPYNN